VLSGAQSPYTVFTPYSKAWLAKANEFYLRSYPAKNYFSAFQKHDPLPLPSLETMGFKTEAFSFPGKKPPEELIRAYDELRDFPAQDATSHLGVHLRFGTISIRELAKEAQKLNAVFLKELIWREFFMQVLWHHPRVVDESFRKQYDRIEWINNEAHFQRWCEGKTGYPIVDAGMRELNATGYMHNRVRMITGSFLTKHLLTDWRRGESYFAEKLLDYELAANNGNWQWVAGTGCDSAPYFRIFNPYEQTKKFDPQGKYIRKWVPEFDSLEYAAPIVEHVKARERALMVYKKAVG
jgi:deoxyribodipyrimidine photo-lyase